MFIICNFTALVHYQSASFAAKNQFSQYNKDPLLSIAVEAYQYML